MPDSSYCVPRVDQNCSTIEMQIDNFDKEEHVICSRTCAAMNVWVHWLTIALAFEEGYPY